MSVAPTDRQRDAGSRGPVSKVIEDHAAGLVRLFIAMRALIRDLQRPLPIGSRKGHDTEGQVTRDTGGQSEVCDPSHTKALGFCKRGSAATPPPA